MSVLVSVITACRWHQCADLDVEAALRDLVLGDPIFRIRRGEVTFSVQCIPFSY
jgi:hypothetical protein